MNEPRITRTGKLVNAQGLLKESRKQKWEMGPRDNGLRTAGLKRERGGFQFEKHYFGSKPVELPQTMPNGDLTEKFKCAQFLDGMPEMA